ncbi:Dirigent protein 25 [Bienertia sinuspersici]
MHDIVGGANPSARPVTGIVDNSLINGQLPFAKPNTGVLPFNHHSNIPFMTGLSGTTSTIFQNNNDGARLPVGPTIEKLVFGTMTVVDDELTLGPELRSGRVGKAQGFYVSTSSAMDDAATSHVLALTAMFKNGGYVDTICFFGVHLVGVSESQVAIMGGTGKFVNAKGFAIIKTLLPSMDQHRVDGLETVLQFDVYVTL